MARTPGNRLTVTDRFCSSRRLLKRQQLKAYATISTKQVEMMQLKKATTSVLRNQRGNWATLSGWNSMLM